LRKENKQPELSMYNIQKKEEGIKPRP
jgi:hypothetical protein